MQTFSRSMSLPATSVIPMVCLFINLNKSDRNQTLVIITYSIS